MSWEGVLRGSRELGGVMRRARDWGLMYIIVYVCTGIFRAGYTYTPPHNSNPTYHCGHR